MKLKKFLALGFFVTTLTLGSVPAFAATYNTPAEIVADILGRTVEDVINERFETGKTYGTIANDAGKLDEFKEASLEMKKENLNEQVAAGLLSREEADEILAAIEARQAYCNGTGIGGGRGTGAGANKGTGRGAGTNKGTGRGKGAGGMRLQDGSCYY